MRILSLTCSSSACERNFSVFQQVQGSKRRNRLLHDKMRDLVFIKANSQLEQKRMNKQRDPLVETTHADVLEDEDNEWITGIVSVPILEVETVDEPEEEPIPQPRARAAPSNRFKARRHRKKLLPAFRDDELQSAGSSSDSNDDAMAASSSDFD
uniref:HAT C-terminal dimerisation domain-containing protein n=1 Tax=Hordeum vulgare subsp. vulgare TaxID=112509 RepID=A0A8I6YA50_HORVV